MKQRKEKCKKKDMNSVKSIAEKIDINEILGGRCG